MSWSRRQNSVSGESRTEPRLTFVINTAIPLDNCLKNESGMIFPLSNNSLQQKESLLFLIGSVSDTCLWLGSS